MMNIIFICTGNTCRSPMAKVIAEDAFKKAGIDASVSSAGVSVYKPSKASDHAIAAAKTNGLCLRGHKSRRVTDEMLKSADLILTMTNGHKHYLSDEFPQHDEKIYTLYEFCAGTDDDIVDPFGGERSDYDGCFGQLNELIKMLTEKLKREGKND